MLFISLDQIKFIWTKFACTRMSCKDAPSECSSLEGPLLAHLNELELAFVRANSRVGLENHSGDIEMYQMDNQSSRGLNLIKDVFKVGACDDNSDKISKEEEFLPVPNSEKEEEIGNGVSHGMMTSISKSNGHPSVLKEKEDLRVVSTKSSNLEEEAALIIQTGESLGFKREKFAQKAGSMVSGLSVVSPGTSKRKRGRKSLVSLKQHSMILRNFKACEKVMQQKFEINNKVVRDNTSLASSAHSNLKEDAMRPDQLNDSPCHYTGFASCETSDKRADQAHNTLKQRSKIS
ncbi:hypothetical protein Q3G72_014720 [Acer saccharum]|nr:hypothetical protein Q3G72_014720 [Acer saccharum]